MSIVQSILIPKRFTLKQAKLMVRENGYKIIKIDTTEKFYRFRQINPKKINPYSYRIYRKGYIIFIYGKLK